MSNAALCQQAVADVGSGIAASLRGVDCITMGATQAAFGRLFGTSGYLLPALTLLLTLYVAFFAIQLLTGRSRLGIGTLTPRIMTMGLVLTFATSWIAYSQVVWNLALGAPNEIAALLTGVRGNATDVFAQKVDILFGVIGEAADGAKQQAAQGAQGGGGEVAAAIKAAMPASMFSAEGMLWMGSMLLVLGTAGVLVATRIALAVMIALGPLFVVLALFNGTRGLFTGWLKGMVLLALAPLFAVLGGSLMLELAVPIVNALTEIPGQLDPRAAMAFFVLGVVHVALMALVMKIATTMVGGWTVFGLAASDSERGNDLHPTQPAVQVQQPAAASASGGSQRRIAISGVPAANAANDIGGAALAGHRTSHVYAIAGDRSATPMAASASSSRSRGIGSRFRAAPARSTEKIR